MSKPVKKMIIDLYREQFAGVDQAMLVDLRGVDANVNNELRTSLAEKQIKVTVVKNSLARQAFRETGLEPLNDLLDGPSAVVYGGDSVVNIARELVGWAKKVGNLELKGAVMEGTVFRADQVQQLSEYPTREEAQAQVLQLVLSPGRRLAGSVTGPGSQIAGLVKAIEEKLENGEQISQAA